MVCLIRELIISRKTVTPRVWCETLALATVENLFAPPPLHFAHFAGKQRIIKGEKMISSSFNYTSHPDIVDVCERALGSTGGFEDH